jgi:glycosyltransferase involved in cell wall biosynthesis
MPPPDDPNPSVAVSVIIPTYNCASYLAAAIESVLAQTYRDFRIFVIDDGSTDATPEVMRPYVYHCVYIHQPNAGAAAARNRGIRESSSKYIAFLDADDLWHPTKLERQIQFLDRHPKVGLICSDFSMMGKGQSVDSFFSTTRVPPDGRMFKHLLQNCIVSTPSAVVPRHVIEETGAFNESLSICEDMNLWLRIASRWDIAAIREVLVTVRRNRPESLSATTGGTVISLNHGLASFQHIEASCPHLSRRDTRALKRKLALFYYKSGSSLLVGGEPQSARVELMRSLRYRSFQPLALVKLGGSLLPTATFRFFARYYKMTFR